MSEAVRAIEGACGAAGAAPRPIVGSSNIWARSEGSGSGATGGAVAVAGSGGWARPGNAVGAGGRHVAQVATTPVVSLCRLAFSSC